MLYRPACRVESFSEAQMRVSLSRPISNCSGHPVGSLEWWMYGIRSHYRLELEVWALLDLEELVEEMIGGYLPVEIGIDRAVHLLRDVRTEWSEVVDTERIRAAVTRLVEGEFRRPERGYYRIVDGVVRLEEELSYWEDQFPGYETVEGWVWEYAGG